jgi:hypothetical protein
MMTKLKWGRGRQIAAYKTERYLYLMMKVNKNKSVGVKITTR